MGNHRFVVRLSRSAGRKVLRSCYNADYEVILQARIVKTRVVWKRRISCRKKWRM